MPIDSFDAASAGALFRTRLMGFDKEEVRVCLRNLASDFDDAHREIERLTGKLKALEGEPAQAALRSPVGVQLEKVPASAHKVAEEVKVEAEADAKKMLSEAQEEAARLRSQAEADASALTRTAAARLAELNTEVERLEARRAALNSQLQRAAEQLDTLSRELRAAALQPEEAKPSWLKSPVAEAAQPR